MSRDLKVGGRAPPEFPDETWAEWEAEKVEQFGPRWLTYPSPIGWERVPQAGEGINRCANWKRWTST